MHHPIQYHVHSNSQAQAEEEAENARAAATLAAAGEFTFHPHIAFEPWKGKYKKYRFMARGMSCGIFQMRIGKTTWQSQSPHFRFEILFQPELKIQLVIPRDTTVLPPDVEPITDLSAHNALMVLPHEKKPKSYSYKQSYQVGISAAHVTKAVHPGGLANTEVVIESSVATLAYQDCDAPDDRALPEDCPVGASLAAALKTDDAAAEATVRFETISVDGCFKGMLRDLRDFCDHVKKHKGHV